MHRTLALTISLLSPLAALALDYSPTAGTYRDARNFSAAESAGVSVLTNLGAVGGYPDGTFHPERTLNRAEFLKIVFLSNPSVIAVEDDADDCFPDVRAGDWFSSYVCLAKRRGDVEGYPDGFFRPANAVNYAEALKMLGELYDYDLPEPPANERWAWYTPYLRAAQTAGVDLTLDVSAELTRGQMARLAAAYRAHAEGQLSAYRDFERGITPRSSSNASSSSSASSVSSSSSSAVSSSSSSSVSSVSQASSTAVSTFMIVGRTSGLLADAIVPSPDEDSHVRSAFVELEQNMDGIDKLLLVDMSGNVLAEMSRRGTDDDTEKQWEGEVTNSFRIVKGSQTRLGLKARLRTIDNGGRSNELFEIDTWRVRLQGVDSGSFTQPGFIDAHLPRHQTTLGKFTDVKNILATSITVTPGLNKLIGTFAFEGDAGTGVTLQVREVNFRLETTGVNVSNIRIGGSSPVQQASCGVEQGTGIVTCSSIPDGMGLFSGTAPQLSIYADIAFQANQTSGTARIVPNGKGAIGLFGGLRWSDGVGTFTWIEASGEMDAGPLVTVTN